MPPVTDPGDPAPSLGLREKKKLAARAAIIEAALDLFADRGFDDATVTDIAARAGVSPATVARYFPSKESLLFAERDQRVPMLRRSIIERPGDETPLEAVLAALHQQPVAAGDTQERLLRSRLAILRSTALRGQAIVVLTGWRTAISEALEHRGVSGADAGVIAVVVTALLDDASDRWALSGGRSDLLELIDESFATLRRISRSTT